MKIFLIVYGILALMFCVWLSAYAINVLRKADKTSDKPAALASICKLFCNVSIFKLLLSSVLFPLTIIYSVVMVIIEDKKRERGKVEDVAG